MKNEMKTNLARKHLSNGIIMMELINWSLNKTLRGIWSEKMWLHQNINFMENPCSINMVCQLQVTNLRFVPCHLPFSNYNFKMTDVYDWLIKHSWQQLGCVAFCQVWAQTWNEISVLDPNFFRGWIRIQVQAFWQIRIQIQTDPGDG